MRETVTVLVVAAIAIALVAASLLRRAGRDQCLVVTRRRRIVRIASESTTVAIPGFHEVLEWPMGPTEIAIVVRTRTLDGQEVRVLATVTVVVDPPRVGTPYVDPRGVLHSALERKVADVVHDQTAECLTDERGGLVGAVLGLRLDALAGLAGGVVTDVVIDEVDLLLHPGRPGHDDV